MSKSDVGGTVTTLALGEESPKAPTGGETTLAVGEEDPAPAKETETPTPQKTSGFQSVPRDNPLGAW